MMEEIGLRSTGERSDSLNIVSSNIETANAVLTKFIGKTVLQSRCCTIERSCDLRIRCGSD
jgi:hypothetical protein